jgi:hypothetical protein
VVVTTGNWGYRLGVENTVIFRISLSLGVALLLGVVAAMPAAELEPELQEQSFRYDTEYPHIGYSDKATDNCIARLQQKLEGGQLRLERDAKWGALPAVLKALDIDVESQLLVYSKTSLQFELVNSSTPRALYFNDDCYVGYVQHDPSLEFTAVDAKRGVVFYDFDDTPQSGPVAAPPHFTRQGGTCLACHDTYTMTGGGVPRVLVMSAVADSPRDPRPSGPAQDVTDRTPVSVRWGGWYVTGHQGRQEHLGNLPLREDETNTQALRTLAPNDRRTLADYFDTSKYLTPHSDLTALLVLEHQSTVQNLIVRANYKLPAVLARAQTQANGNDAALRTLLEPLVRALFFEGAATLNDTLEGNTGFARRFVARGPADAQQRSLRQFDLKTRVFRWPLSYLVYSEAFDAMPELAWNYLADRIAQVLRGEDTTGLSARIPESDRKAVVEILTQTHPRLAQRLAESRRR